MAAEPLIPYLNVPDLVLVPAHFIDGFPSDPISIKPFGTLVALGVYIGAYYAVVQGKRRGLSERALMSLILYVTVSSFVCGHVLDLLFYYPGQVLEDPLALLRLWDGLSSFGGFVGALLAGLVWRARHRVALLPYADALGSTFPIGWSLGRLGCSIAHDHPGRSSDVWWAVRYPDGGRFDLGLLELAITIPLAIFFVWCWRRPRPWGFYIGIMSVYYAPLRFLMDFLRARPEDAPGYTGSIDPRYAGLTPAQWACLALFSFGVFLLVQIRLKGEAAYRPPAVPRAFSTGSSSEAESPAGHAGSQR
jgi:phosphatidylglycerol:prolipoprotein diacylglycerol transferase